MSIVYNEAEKTLTLTTANSAYQMLIDELGFLRHLHYGSRIAAQNMSYQHLDVDVAFSGNPVENRKERNISPDTMPQEYTSFGVGDFRLNSIALVNTDGSRAVQFRYLSHEICKGKYAIPGLPAAYDNGDEADTLIVTLGDAVSGIKVRLYYGVFEKQDVITRCAEIINEGAGTVTLEKAASLALDMPYGNWDLMHFWGKHCLERQPERVPLSHSITTIGSTRGMTSHQHNPFIILCDHEASEDHGECYGLMLAYSGGFKAEIEMNQIDTVRVVMGIDETYFSW